MIFVYATMPPQLVLAVKVLATAGKRTHVRALFVVGALVLGQVGRLAEALAADVADEGLLALVGAHVHCQCTLLTKGLVTAGKLARQRFGVLVDQQVLLACLLG